MPKKTKQNASSSSSLTNQEYANIGRMLAVSIENGLYSKKQVYRTAFIKGIISGFGGVLGATVVVALLLWVLTLLSDVSIIGPIVESLKNTVSEPIQ